MTSRYKPLVIAALVAALTIVRPTPAAPQTVIPDAPTCPTCRVEISTVAKLIGPDATQAFPQSSVVEDSQGRYWTLPWGAPAIVFDARGALAGVAKTTGDEPGAPLRFVREGAAAGDSVVLLSADEAIVFGPDMKIARVAQLPAKANLYASVLRWPDRVLLNGLVAAYARQPFLLAQLTSPAPRVIKPFGGENATGRTATRLSRIDAPPRNGRFWAADLSSYRLSQWTLDGDPVTSLVRKPEWFPDFTGLDPTNIPAVLAVSEDERGRLWVFLSLPKADWKRTWNDAMAKCPPPGTDRRPPEARCTVSPWRLSDEVLEIIDPASGSVLLHQTLDRWIYQALPSGKLVAYSDVGGAAHIEILRMELKEP